MHILNALLIAVAYAYLIYKLVTFNDYALLAESIQTAEWGQIVALVVAFALMPLNIFLEAIKWRALQRDVEGMTLRDANRQVYYGYVGAFVTPYRAGDFPARVLLMKDRTHWPAAIGMGLVGMLGIMVVEAGLGFPACYMLASYAKGVEIKSIGITLAVIIGGLLITTLVVKHLSHWRWQNPKLIELFTALHTLTPGRFLYIVMLSLLRYSLWAVQLSMVLYFCSVDMTLKELLIAIPSYYLLVGFMPSLPVADMAIRGSWSILTFGVFSPNTPGIALAAVLVWIGNTIVPMIVGTMIKKNEKNVNEVNDLS